MKTNLSTNSSNVSLYMTCLKCVSFETEIIEGYRCRKSSIEKTLVEICLKCCEYLQTQSVNEASRELGYYNL